MLAQVFDFQEKVVSQDPSRRWEFMRNKAYMLTAHQGLMRTNEIITLRCSDLCINLLEGRPRSITFTFPRSKTGRNQTVCLPLRTKALCAISSLFAWLKLLEYIDDLWNISPSVLAKGIWPQSRRDLDTPLQKPEMMGILKSSMLDIGVPAHLIHLISLHGLRTGGTCDLRDAGTSTTDILTHG